MIKEITNKDTLGQVVGGVSITVTASSNGERSTTSSGLDNPNIRASVDGVAITPEAPSSRPRTSFSGLRNSVFVRSAGGRTSITSFTSSNGSVSGTVTSNGVTTTIG